MTERQKELIAGLNCLKILKFRATDIADSVTQFNNAHADSEPLAYSASTITQIRKGNAKLPKQKELQWIDLLKSIFETHNWDYEAKISAEKRRLEQVKIEEEGQKEQQYIDNMLTGNSPFVALPEAYCGVFVGYYMSTQHKKMEETVFFIEKSGKTIGKNALGSEYRGVFQLQFNQHLFIGSFYADTSQEAHRFTITCNNTGFSETKYMNGVYSGKGERYDSPMLGITRLYKEASLAEAAEFYKDREPHRFDITYPTSRRQKMDLRNDRIEAVMLLCLGKTEQNTVVGDTLDFFEGINMFPPIVDSRIAPLQGSFTSFKADTKGDIYCNQIRIFNMGYVEMKSATDTEARFLGRAYLNPPFLHIFFYKKHFPAGANATPERVEPHYSYYSYKLGHTIERRESMEHVFGLSSHITDTGLRAGYEILMPLEEGIVGEQYNQRDSLKITPAKCSEAEKNVYLETYPPLIQFFEPSRRLVITEDRSQNGSIRSQPSERANTHFAAACYSFYKNNNELGFKNLKLAQEFGFKELNRLKSEIENGLLSSLNSEEVIAIKKLFKID